MNNKRKILLIHPLGVNWVPGRKDMSRIANIMPPLGLCSLAAWVERHGHAAAIHDCFAAPMNDAALIARVREEAPDFLGVSVTTSSFHDGARIAAMVKAAFPNIKTVFGGVHVSALRERLLRDCGAIDYAVVGEGEETLLELMEANGEGAGAIRGLLVRDGDEVRFTGARAARRDLDEFPFPAYEKLPGYPGRYLLPIFSYPRTPGTTASTSRGCPYQCTYCDRSVFGRAFGFHSARYMFEMVKHLHHKFGIRHINFYDDLFTFKRERVVEFCEALAGSGLGVTFNCAARAEHIDEELLRLMRRAGCWMMSLGIETGDPDLLKQHRPNTNLDLIAERVRWIKKAGIRAKGLFMLGLPGETEASIDRSMDYVLKLPLDDFNLAKFTPFPGSPLYQNIKEYGNFEENWELMNCLNFVFVATGFTKERLEARYKEFYRRYYERPAQGWKFLSMIWKSPDSWRRFLGSLGDFMSVRNEFSGKGKK